MKKIYSILLAVFCCSLSLMAAPYGLLINGSTKLEATSLSEKDFQDRDQFLVPCVELKQGDKVQLHDFANGAAWMCAIDPYGEYQKFSGGKEQGYLICNADGKYDFYIKLKFEDDMLYIGPAENCGGNGNGNEPNPTPGASVPAACPDVMLQGFYWDSNQDKQHGNTKWQHSKHKLRKYQPILILFGCHLQRNLQVEWATCLLNTATRIPHGEIEQNWRNLFRLSTMEDLR